LPCCVCVLCVCGLLIIVRAAMSPCDPVNVIRARYGILASPSLSPFKLRAGLGRYWCWPLLGGGFDDIGVLFVPVLVLSSVYKAAEVHPTVPIHAPQITCCGICAVQGPPTEVACSRGESLFPRRTFSCTLRASHQGFPVRVTFNYSSSRSCICAVIEKKIRGL